MTLIEISSFVNLENIPVAETGIDYPASTGPVSLTSSMFEEAVRFTQDPHGLQPRIKISHGANPIDEDLQSLFEAYNQDRDASLPALGTIINLRTHNAGHTLVGDWYGLPEWLAAILASAYPARSVEGGAWHNDANNKSYDFMISAVALLGVIGPGCTSLADLQELFSKEGPKISVIEMARPKTDDPIQMGGGTSHMPPAALQVNVEDMRRLFYDEFAQGERYWWWDRELLAEPWEFIVSDLDTGQLYRVPFTPEEDANNDTVISEWGEPEPIKIQYVPDAAKVQAGVALAAGRTIAPQLSKAGIMLAVNMNSPRQAEFEAKKEAKAAMAIDIPSLRTLLKLSEEDLPDDATEEQINSAISGGATVVDDPAGTGGSEEEPTEETDEVSIAAAHAVIKKHGGTVVDMGTWERTKSGAELAIKQARDARAAADKALLETRVREGALTPASSEAYLKALAGPKDDHNGPDREQMLAHIKSLEKGVTPVTELGSAEDGSAARSAVLGTGLIPELEAERAKSAQGA